MLTIKDGNSQNIVNLHGCPLGGNLKREILCTDCKEIVRKQFPTDTPYPGEHVKFVSGVSLSDCVCDNCATEIYRGEPCTAFSIWADYGGVPCFEWENEYLEVPNDT